MTHEEEANLRTREYLRPKAWAAMMKELEPWDGQDHILDPRDHEPFIDMLKAELDQCERIGQHPAIVFEEFSPNVEKPRTAHLLEALKFLNMIGRVAMINDTPAPAPRQGWIAQIIVV